MRERDDDNNRTPRRPRSPRRAGWIVGVVALLLAGSFYLLLTRSIKPNVSNVSELTDPASNQCSTRSDAAGYCVKIYFGTTRKVTEENAFKFTDEFDPFLGFGYSEVLVPFLDFTNKETASGATSISEDGENIFPARNPSSEWGERVALTVFKSSTKNSLRANAEEKLYFVKEFQKDVKISSDEVLLYIHGMDQTFDDAIETAAVLTVDLASGNKLGAEAAIDEDRLYQHGQPVVYSWPTDEFIYDPGRVSLLGKKESQQQSYYKSQRSRAPQSGSQLAEFLDTLTIKSKAKKVNIIVHSMGNRVLLSAIKDFAKQYVEESEREIDIRFIHAAAEPRYSEYGAAINEIYSLASKTRRWDPKTVIYSSSSDVALMAAYLSDSIDQISIASKSCPLGTWGDRKGLIWEACYVPYVFENSNFSTIDVTGLELTYEDRDTGKTESDLGHGYFSNSPAMLADIGCALDEGGDNSPIRALVRAERNVKRSDLEGWKFKPPYNARRTVKWYKFDEAVQADLRCKRTKWVEQISSCIELRERVGVTCKTLNETRHDFRLWRSDLRKGIYRKKPPIPENFVTSKCDVSKLQESIINFQNGTTVIPPRPVLFEIASSEVKTEMLSRIHSMIALINQSSCTEIKLVVTGYTDTSGREVSNKALSFDRANAVAAILREQLSASNTVIDIEVSGVGETTQWGVSADDEPTPWVWDDGLRSKLNRRVYIAIRQ